MTDEVRPRSEAQRDLNSSAGAAKCQNTSNDQSSLHVPLYEDTVSSGRSLRSDEAREETVVRLQIKSRSYDERTASYA